MNVRSVPPSDFPPASGRELARAIGGGQRVVAYLPGGGVTGGLYQLGALAALEDGVPGFRANALHGYLAVGSGAVVGAALAGGLEVQRLYRALLDPADTLFALERRHIIRVDLAEWRRTAAVAFAALQRTVITATSRPVETAADPWAEIDRFQDVLPAGIFSLEHLERFLESFFERRGIPSTFRAMPRPLVVPAHDLDSGTMATFGMPPHEHVHIARAICASMALPLFFAPVRIGDRLYFAGSTGIASALDLAVEALGAQVVVVINPLVPVSAGGGMRVPTGHGAGEGVRDKGLLWIFNQAMRIGEHAQLTSAIALLRTRRPEIEVIVVEPASTDAVIFMYSPMNYSARRAILEETYRTVRALCR